MLCNNKKKTGMRETMRKKFDDSNNKHYKIEEHRTGELLKLKANKKAFRNGRLLRCVRDSNP
jgi:hypothetical protein